MNRNTFRSVSGVYHLIQQECKVLAKSRCLKVHGFLSSNEWKLHIVWKTALLYDRKYLSIFDAPRSCKTFPIFPTSHGLAVYRDAKSWSVTILIQNFVLKWPIFTLIRWCLKQWEFLPYVNFNAASCCQPMISSPSWEERR